MIITCLVNMLFLLFVDKSKSKHREKDRSRHHSHSSSKHSKDDSSKLSSQSDKNKTKDKSSNSKKDRRLSTESASSDNTDIKSSSEKSKGQMRTAKLLPSITRLTGNAQSERLMMPFANETGYISDATDIWLNGRRDAGWLMFTFPFHCYSLLLLLESFISRKHTVANIHKCLHEAKPHTHTHTHTNLIKLD